MNASFCCMMQAQHRGRSQNISSNVEQLLSYVHSYGCATSASKMASAANCSKGHAASRIQINVSGHNVSLT